MSSSDEWDDDESNDESLEEWLGQGRTKFDLTEEELEADTDQLIEELDELFGGPRKPCYQHSFVPCSLACFASAVRSIEIGKLSPLPGILWSEPRRRENLRCAEIQGGTLVWHHQSVLTLIRYLSKVLGVETHWIDANEEMACRAYAHFVDGQTMLLIRDPVYGYETGRWESGDLAGKGSRDFESLDEFYAAVAAHYRPRDQFWCYNRWDRKPDEEEMQVAEGEWKATERCFTLFLGDQDFRVEPAGDWTGCDFAAECEKVLGVRH